MAHLPSLARALLVLTLLLPPGIAAAQTNTDLPRVPLTIGKHSLVAEVAASTPTRTVGLMNRFSLRPDHGMLFVFAAPQPLGFWMRNTYVPLSIAFLDASGRILNIEDMAPQTEVSHRSAGPALYALEMKKGWFAERGIGPGDVVQGLAAAGKARD
jgi:uncharacterized membrane protein (UPF0127 family)